MICTFIYNFKKSIYQFFGCYWGVWGAKPHHGQGASAEREARARRASAACERDRREQANSIRINFYIYPKVIYI